MKIDFSSIKKYFSSSSGVLGPLAGILPSSKAATEKITVCDLGLSKIVLIEVSKKSNGEVCVEKFEYIRNTLRDQQPALLLKPFFEDKKFKKEGLRITLKSQGVIIRFIHFPKMKREDLDGAMKYEIEPYIPFKLDECVMDYAIVDDNVKTPDGEKMEIMLVVAKRQDLTPMLEIFRSLECKLATVDVDILSAMAALEFFFPQDFAGHVGLLDIGTEISTLGIIRDGRPRFVRDISYGAYDVQKRVRARAGLPPEEVEHLWEKNEAFPDAVSAAIVESLEGLIGDLKASFDYYREQAHCEKPIQKLFVSGRGALNPIVLKSLSEGLGIPLEPMDVCSKLKVADSVDAEQLRKYAAFLPVVLGLALRSE